MKIFVDNNIFDASVLVEKDIAQHHKLLREDIKAIEEIRALNIAKRIKFYISPNILIEDLARNLAKIQKINNKWNGFIHKCKILESGNKFIIASYDKEHRKFSDPNERYKSNQHFLELKKTLKDKNGKDSANIIEAESATLDYFMTVDYRLINKVRNEGREIVKIKVMRPVELLEKIHIKSNQKSQASK